MIDNKAIAEKIKAVRERLGLTQEEFGQLIGISKQSVSSWEKGRNLPDILNIDKIAALSGKTLGEFFADAPLKMRHNLPPAEETEKFTEREKQVIYKLRAISASRRRAFETLLGVKNNHCK